MPVVTSNPNHGYDIALPTNISSEIKKGNHTLRVFLTVDGTDGKTINVCFENLSSLEGPLYFELPRSPACVGSMRLLTNLHSQ